jgi:thiamine biosynthesis protein ThiI
MKEMILAKGGEIVLKGANRYVFEKVLNNNMKSRLDALGNFRIRSAQSTIFIEPLDDFADMDEAYDQMKKVFGIIALSRAVVCEKDLSDIQQKGGDYLEETLRRARTFKVEAKRSDKKFPYKSPQICDEMGGYLLSRFPHLKVDVHHPDVEVRVEVRDFAAFVHAGNEKGAGGMPLGGGGKATLLLSGGIDSPVAGYMMAKRGLSINGVHFYSYPYTSERAKEKVFDLAKKMCQYCDKLELMVVPFTKIQTIIKDQCPEEYFTLIMRRFMMQIAQRLAKQSGSQGLITGESLGQVASQTLQALYVTNYGLEMPVFRPCIGMDKEEIIQIARKIDTFDTSILPYEDCCTVFTPRHPKIKPDIHVILSLEEKLDFEALVQEAVSGTETVVFER